MRRSRVTDSFLPSETPGRDQSAALRQWAWHKTPQPEGCAWAGRLYVEGEQHHTPATVRGSATLQVISWDHSSQVWEQDDSLYALRSPWSKLSQGKDKASPCSWSYLAGEPRHGYPACASCRPRSLEAAFPKMGWDSTSPMVMLTLACGFPCISHTQHRLPQLTPGTQYFCCCEKREAK